MVLVPSAPVPHEYSFRAFCVKKKKTIVYDFDHNQANMICVCAKDVFIINSGSQQLKSLFDICPTVDDYCLMKSIGTST